MWDLLPIFWDPPSILVSSLALLFAAHTAQAGSITYLFLSLLVIPWCSHFQNRWGPLCNWAMLFVTNSLSLALFGDSKPHPDSAKSQPLSRTPQAFKTSLTWVALTLPSSAASIKYNLGCLWHPREHFPEDFAAMMLISADSSVPAEHHPFSQLSNGFILVALVSC